MIPLELITALVGGAALAIFYFAGLWWTIRFLPQSQHPIAAYFASLVARLTVTLMGFGILIVLSPWQTVVACLCGFMLARLLLVQFLGNERWGNEANPERVAARSLK